MFSEKSRNVFEEMGVHWAEIANENFTAEQLNFIKNNVKKDALVLDLACGTGRHTNPLSKEGCAIIGFDLSPDLLRIAQNSGHSQFVNGDMRYLPFRSNIFTHVLSIDTSFGYLPSEREDLNSLREVSRILIKDGTFLLDVFNGEYLDYKYLRLVYRLRNFFKSLPFWILTRYTNRIGTRLFSPMLKWRQYPSFFLSTKRWINKSEKRFNESWIVRDKSDEELKVYRHSVRLLYLEPLNALLNKANLKVGKVFGGYEQEAFDFSSKRIVIVAHSI